MAAAAPWRGRFFGGRAPQPPGSFWSHQRKVRGTRSGSLLRLELLVPREHPANFLLRPPGSSLGGHASPPDRGGGTPGVPGY
ncbi:hypothetical protein NDU88_012127 [Pleurodeles waltl]|uniref:Uncharacterized protein n=1 Tax=Pleurodeles waltl TaxID=8319 RepID=A0AAV7QZA6_PLEWA|nr:hypothetical protein NDU88_012127 [Pleurodeles waltl]